MSMTRGGRNLIILGIGALGFSIFTTGVSLAIYRATGDIYLDRSRPGYLPDEEEATSEPEAVNFVFPETGPIDRSELDEYLKELQRVTDRLNEFSDPYAPDPLSDESLGIAPDADSEPENPE